MRVLVCGGREFADPHFVAIILGAIHRQKTITKLIHGDARGADRLAARWAQLNLIDTEPYPILQQDRDRYGNMAGRRRNGRMLIEGKPDLVVAFPGGSGTAHMVKMAEDSLVKVYRADPAAFGGRRS